MLSTENSAKLVEMTRFGRETICSENDSSELLVLGIAEADGPDTIYFADNINFKLKRLNIVTHQIDEVRFVKLVEFFF